jgi:ElaB/YqjD/DUF883 family membrane-anchored ribosome-binding protein
VGTQPEELSTSPAAIEATRADLSRNIDELTDKVSPQRVMQRRKDAAKGRLSSIREKVMGTASTTGSHVASAGSGIGDSASGAVGSVTDTAQGAVGTVQSRTQGNPLAAGMIAFGAGMLISALIPASDKEAQAAQRMVETAKEQGLVDTVSSVGQETGQNLKEAATGAAEEVKSTVQDSAQTVVREGQSSAQTVRDQSTPS